MQAIHSKAGLVLRDDGEVFVLALSASPQVATLRAAAGIVALEGPSDGRTRALEVFEEGGVEALNLAREILRRTAKVWDHEVPGETKGN